MRHPALPLLVLLSHPLYTAANGLHLRQRTQKAATRTTVASRAGGALRARNPEILAAPLNVRPVTPLGNPKLQLHISQPHLIQTKEDVKLGGRSRRVWNQLKVRAAEAMSGDSRRSKLWRVYESTMSVATNLFPVWTLLSALLAVKNPTSFAWFDTTWFTAGLGILMLSMGITLTPADFAKVLTKPLPVLVGFISCYGLMPAIAFGLAKLFALSPAMTAGLVLCGSINGGQASNLCAYIARGNVALSVMMTLSTTVGAIFMTPLLAKYILGTTVPVDAVGIAISTMQVVLLPLILGMGMKRVVPKFVDGITPLTPVVGVVATCLLVGSAVAQVAPDILSAGGALQWAAMLLHLTGGIFGYWLMRLLKQDEITARTSGIETSMKSSAFGFLLAKLHFGDYAVRVPPAVSVVWMALIGATMAVIWRGMPIKDDLTGKLADKPSE